MKTLIRAMGGLGNILMVALVVIGAPIAVAVAIALLAALVAAPFFGVAVGVLVPLHWFGVI